MAILISDSFKIRESTSDEWKDILFSINSPGVPVGGTAGQYLVKQSGMDYDTEWIDLPEPESPTYSNTIILNGWVLPAFRVVGYGTIMDLALPYPYTAVKSYNFTTAKLFDNNTWKDVSVLSCEVPSYSNCIRIQFNLDGVTLIQYILLANLVGTIVLE